MLTKMTFILESHKNQCSAQFNLFDIRFVVEAGSIEKNFLHAVDTQFYLLMEVDQTDQLLKPGRPQKPKGQQDQNVLQLN